MAKRTEKSKFDRYPHINLVPFILETTGRPWPHMPGKFINFLLRDADNPPIAVRDTWSTIQSVLHSAISKQQLTAARYVTLGDCCHTQFVLYAPCLWMQVPSRRERTQIFQSQAYCSCAMWPCCDISSSDDDEHNTDSNFLLLFTGRLTLRPLCLRALTEVDVSHVALGCRFALDIFTISQQHSPTPDHEPLPSRPWVRHILSTGSTQALRLSRRPTDSHHVHFSFPP